MLELFDTAAARDCGGTSRRDFLQIGAVGLGGWTLSSLLADRSRAAEAGYGYKNRSVVVLFLCGGATHIETFDPKPNAPADFRSVTGHIQTSIPGVHFGSTYRGLAQRADKLAVVRSYAPHPISDHAMAIRHVLTTGSAGGVSLGSKFARARGTSHPETGMPSYCTLIEPNEVDEQYMEDRERMRAGSQPGTLGKAFAGFDPGAGSELKDDMQLKIPVQRLNDRRALLAELDRVRSEIDASGTMDAVDEYRRQAVDVILGGDVRKALDLSQEDPKVLARYRTGQYQVGWTKKRPSTIGERLLLARRLCQAGCGFVTVGYAGWDNHANDIHPNVKDGMELLGRPLDHAVSAFLDDVKAQGMEDEILFVIMSEFGRTPKIGKKGGRDHWPGLSMLVLSGGGLQTGQVVGESTAKAEEPQSDPLGFDHLRGTIWNSLYEIGKLRLKPGLPRELLSELETAKPIPQLV